MSGIRLESLGPCFQGLLPGWLFTCSADGVPNVAMLSHVDFVDSKHVALSFQFFNKSRRNIAQNPKALVRFYDPDTLQSYLLELRYVRSEEQGPLFESMRLRIEAIASYSGLKGIFKLLAADIYEVMSVRAEGGPGAGKAAGKRRRGGGPPAPVPFTMKALQEISDRIHQAPNLECLLESILETIENLFGFRHSMILLAGEVPDRFTTIATRGYGGRGAGSEVKAGEGIIGMVAEARRPIRISGLLSHLLYAHAVGKQAGASDRTSAERSIPLPGLSNPDSQLGIPLLAHGELLGVLCVESESGPYRFHEEDKTYLEVLGGYVAIAIQNALLRERSEEPDEDETQPPRSRRSAAAPSPGGKALEVAYYAGDECILVNGEYLVRSLPARILWKLLSATGGAGRKEFTNRQLRLDKSLSLPEFRDNLESRLILLRRRLEERCPQIRIVPSGRGRFLLEMDTAVTLAQKP